MANKKITDLVEITSAADVDVLAIVDVSADTTNKIKVDNLPVSAPVQTALDAKQETLVSGTNIKTINSTSLLGSGDISISANPAGTSGQIQFNDSSAFGADSNLFWDNTNKRLGVGTSSPTTNFQVVKNANSTTGLLVSNSDTTNLSSRASITVNSGGVVGQLVAISGNDVYMGALASTVRIGANGGTDMLINTSGNISMGTPSVLSARLGIKGSGSTSATTSLLVQNSSGTDLLKVQDDGDITNGADGNINLKFQISPSANKYFRLTRQNTSVDFYSGNGGNALIETSGGQAFSLVASSTYLTLSNGGVRIASAYGTTNSSSQLEVVSTTKGFLPPRMTTTQKNAISSPASGLMVYDTDTNKLCCYNGSTWNDLF